MKQEIRVQKTQNPKQKPDQSNLGFGRYFTDHMFIMDYSSDKGWYQPVIVPYAPLQLDPATMVLHYGQGIFEGLKAYRTKDGRINLFRPIENLKRINISNDRMCIPLIDADFVLDAIKTLVKLDEDWIPDKDGTSLYIRPFIISADPFLGVRPAETYKLIIILSPVGAYYPEGLNPTKIYVENNYVRSVKGGVGFAKTMGNYAASLKAQQEAKKKGYSQVLWLDGIHKKYIEEVGTSNVFFKIGKGLVTPPLEGSILPGITRDSVISLLRKWNIPVIERQITIQEVFDAHKQRLLDEAFATGTAAVISPIGELNWDDNIITINSLKIGELSAKLYNTITDIQYGRIPDDMGWIFEV